MSEGLSNFLVELASDPEFLGRFHNDPARELDQWSERLTAEERVAILSRNSRQLREALDTRGDRAASDMCGTGGGRGHGDDKDEKDGRRGIRRRKASFNR